MDKKSFELPDEISHLKPEEIEDIYNKFLSNELTPAVMSKYKIYGRKSKIIGLLPPEELDDVLCDYCNVPMLRRRTTDRRRDRTENPIFCYKCDHRLFSRKNSHSPPLCLCVNCATIRANEDAIVQQEASDRIEEIYSLDKEKPVEYEDLGLFQKLIILTLLRTQTSEDFNHILPLDDLPPSVRLSPTARMDSKIIESLFKSKIIIVDPKSRIDAFSEEKKLKAFFPTMVKWIPNIRIGGDGRANLKDLQNKLYNELKAGPQLHWNSDIRTILVEICSEEVLQYVHIRASELRVKFSAENKTREIVNLLLTNFSVSEIYYFVKKSVENAHIYYTTKRVNNKHAANTIPNKMLSLGERALNEKWSTYKYHRDSRAPRSNLSLVFFDFFLKAGDSGFDTPPETLMTQKIYPKCYIKNDETPDESANLMCEKCKETSFQVKIFAGALSLSCRSCGNSTSYTMS